MNFSVPAFPALRRCGREYGGETRPASCALRLPVAEGKLRLCGVVGGRMLAVQIVSMPTLVHTVS